MNIFFPLLMNIFFPLLMGLYSYNHQYNYEIKAQSIKNYPPKNQNIVEMELELGLKITKLRDDLTSTNFWFAKDRPSKLKSFETETMFILTGHLKGFRRDKLKIEINEEGTLIKICGEKLVQEMVMMGWTMHKKDVEIYAFKKVFQIPDGVVLDRIKAKFNEEEAVLTIRMPKCVKGIRGVGIEEVVEEVAERDRSKMTEKIETQKMETPLEEDVLKEQEDKDGEVAKIMDNLPRETEIAHGKEPEKTFPDVVKQTEVEQERTLAKQDSQEATEISKALETCASKLSESIEHVETQVFEQTEIPSSQHAKHEDENVKGQISQVETKMQKQNSEKMDTQEKVEAKPDQEVEEEMIASSDLREDQTSENEKSNGQEVTTVKQEALDDKASEIERPCSTTSKLFGSCFYAGSAVLVTLLVFVVHLIRPKKK